MPIAKKPDAHSPNFVVPEQEYKGNTGAGDAFQQPFSTASPELAPAECLRFAAAAAAISLADVSPPAP
jgi:sugar/nucleoside kinase (ribokinase family)